MEHASSSAEHIMDVFVGDEQEYEVLETQTPDLEKLEQEKLLQCLGANREEGLSSEEAAHRLKIYGPNVFKMPKEEDTKGRRWINKVCICLEWDPIIPEHKNMMRLMLNPISWAMFFAAIVTASLYAIGGDKLYLYDALAMTSLLLLNYASCYVAMITVRNEKAPLIGALKPKTKVLRDGRWKEEDPANLVPGDIIFLKWGDIVPADVCIIDNYRVKTARGMPLRGVRKSIVDCQEYLISGECVAVVIATGRNISKVRPNCCGRPGQLRRGVATAGNFCFWVVVIGTLIELTVTASRNGCRSILHDHLILLIGGLPMAMPAVFYLCMACGARKLCQLGVGSRGTVGLEDLAAIDTVFFNMTGTLTLNEPKFDRSKIHMIATDMDVDDAILVAAKSNLTECNLSREPVDAAILNMVSNPKQAIFGPEVEERYSPFDFYRKLSSSSFRLKDGRFCDAIKGDPKQVMWNCQSTGEIEKEITNKIENLARDGYETLMIAIEDFPTESGWKPVALMPYKDDLRQDCVETIGSLTEMGLRVIILTGGGNPIKKEICTRLGVHEGNIYYYMDTEVDLTDGLLSKAKLMAISDVYAGIKEDIMRYAVTKMGYRCAIVGGGRNDMGALEHSQVAISGPNACYKAKCLSDLVLTTTDLNPLVKSAQINRVTSEMMASYLIYAVSSTVHVFGILLISLIRRDSFSCFLVLIMAFFNYGLGFAFLGESNVRSRSPIRWKVGKMVGAGVIYGCLISLTTIIFVWSSNLFPGVFKVRPLSGDDMRAALFLQTSIANQAVVFLARCKKCRLVECPGPTIFGVFSLLQMAATMISVYADLGFGVKGIGWGWAAVIWMYNCLFLLVVGLIKFIAYHSFNKGWSWIRIKGALIMSYMTQHL